MDRSSPKFGWVISGTLIGAAIGTWLAQEPPVYDNHIRAIQAARLKAADRLIPFVVTASVAGAVFGWLAERRLGQRIPLTVALAILVFLAVALPIAIKLIQFVRDPP